MFFINIFDSHAHYDDPAFDSDRDILLEQIFSEDICNVINVGCNIEGSRRSVALSRKYPQIFAAVGVHPQEILKEPENFIDAIESLCKKEKKIVAIGEIGLDYHYDDAPPADLQKEAFEMQLTLAKNLDLPVIIHSRDATRDTLVLLKKHKPVGVVHCFSGSLETANEILNLGMYIGLGGTVTFKNAKNQPAVAQSIPIDRLLLETDAPYMAPVPFRGKRCDSSLIKYTAAKICELRNIPLEELLHNTKINAERLFLRV